MTIDRTAPPGSSSRVGAWAAAGVGLYVLLGIASLFATAILQNGLAPLGWVAEAGTSSWGVRLAAQPLVWGAMVAVAAAWLGRRLIPEFRPTRSAAALLGLGLVLAATTTFLLHEFVRERHHWFDPDYAGFATFAAPATVAVALAAWARASVPRGHARPLLLLHGAAAVAFGLAVLPSVPGLQDGIRATSHPLVAVLVLDGVYVLGGLIRAAYNRPMQGPVERYRVP